MSLLELAMHHTEITNETKLQSRWVRDSEVIKGSWCCCKIIPLFPNLKKLALLKDKKTIYTAGLISLDAERFGIRILSFKQQLDCVTL